MKKLHLLAALILLSITTFANFNNTRLVISAMDNNNNNLRIAIDGYDVGYRYKNGNSYLINNISSSYHRIQIFKYTTGIFGNNKERIIFDRNIFLKQYYETNILLNNYGNISINEYPIVNDVWNDNNNYPPKNRGCNNGRGRKKGHENCHDKYDDDDRYENNNSQSENREWSGYN